MAEQPTILALDFDGVICDGMLEYFQVSWQTYCQAWNITEEPPEGLAEGFYRTRPVIETGWEMPVLIRALIQNISEAEILQNWPAVLTRLVEQAKPDASTLGPLLDQVRDQWIQQDLTGWLALHRFYPGVTDHLKRMLASPIKLVIITTKEERFTRSLLQQADLEMPEGTVFGKGHKRPKYQTIRELLAASDENTTLWFVEDRIQALQAVHEQSDLSQVQLFLAEWGYNTQSERDIAQQAAWVSLLSLEKFTQDFLA